MAHSLITRSKRSWGGLPGNPCGVFLSWVGLGLTHKPAIPKSSNVLPFFMFRISWKFQNSPCLFSIHSNSPWSSLLSKIVDSLGPTLNQNLSGPCNNGLSLDGGIWASQECQKSSRSRFVTSRIVKDIWICWSDSGTQVAIYNRSDSCMSLVAFVHGVFFFIAILGFFKRLFWRVFGHFFNVPWRLRIA